MQTSDTDRRRAPRYDTTFRVVCNDGEVCELGEVVNLSESGALVRSEGTFCVGDVLSVAPVGGAGETMLDMSAKVVRIADAPSEAGAKLYGLQFEDAC